MILIHFIHPHPGPLPSREREILEYFAVLTSFYEKKLCKALSFSGSIQHSIFCPRRSMRISPAWRSSLMWWEIVEGTMPRSCPSSPTQAQPASPVPGLMLVTVPGRQQAVRRMKIIKRLGLDRALNISANSSIFLSR